MAQSINQDNVCQMCGVEGYKELLVHCSSCGVYEHMYCMEKVILEAPKEWKCDECQIKTQDHLAGKGVDESLVECPRNKMFKGKRKHTGDAQPAVVSLTTVSSTATVTIAPAAKGIQIKEPVAKGIQIREPVSAARLAEVAGKGKGIEIVEPKAPSSEQLSIDLIMEEIEEKVNEMLKYFDNWSNKRLHDRYSDFLTVENIEELIHQENIILKWTSTTNIQEALKRRELVSVNVRRANLQTLLRQRMTNYKPTDKTGWLNAKVNMKLQQILESLNPKDMVIKHGIESSGVVKLRGC